MLWKRELINRNPVYVNIFRDGDFFSVYSRLLDDSDANEYAKTIVKDNGTSDAARNTAVRMRKANKNPEEIFLHINKAICFAEIDSEKLGLA